MDFLAEFIKNLDMEDLKNVFLENVCPSEFGLKTLDDIGKCEGDDEITCKKCWEYALK